MLDLHPFIAERQGFEPRVPRGTTVFKTAAIDHSATSPKLFVRAALFFKGGAKVGIIFYFANISEYFFSFLLVFPSYSRIKRCTEYLHI